MLPFALPSRAEALVVSPGDAFGFGRGHFTGTGTPSLRSARESAGTLGGGGGGGGGEGMGAAPGTPRGLRAYASSSSSHSLSGRTTPLSSRLPGGDADLDVSSEVDPDADPDASSEAGLGPPLSVASASSAASAASATTTSSSVFAAGKGFAAGGYWQPVPLLGEEVLERVGEVMRREARRWEEVWGAGAHQRAAGMGAGGGTSTAQGHGGSRPWAINPPAPAERRGSPNASASAGVQVLLSPPPPLLASPAPGGEDPARSHSSPLERAFAGALSPSNPSPKLSPTANGSPNANGSPGIPRSPSGFTTAAARLSPPAPAATHRARAYSNARGGGQGVGLGLS